jgi:thioredoxin-like negative regulator of GroEL
MLQAEGRHQEAIEHFAAALKQRPTYTEARLRMGSSLRRTGHAEAALEQYRQVLAGDADLPEARMGFAMTLVKLHRDLEARDTLAEAANAPGAPPVFVHALARLLASSPDDRVRDGKRAMELVQQLLQRGRTPDLGETYAMTLAELGEYREAASVQRDLMRGAAQHADVTNATPRLAARLQLYERAEPCRTPWTDEEMP